MRGLIHFLIQVFFSLMVLYCLLHSAGIRQEQILGFFNSQVMPAISTTPDSKTPGQEVPNSDSQTSSIPTSSVENEIGTTATAAEESTERDLSNPLSDITSEASMELESTDENAAE